MSNYLNLVNNSVLIIKIEIDLRNIFYDRLRIGRRKKPILDDISAIDAKY